MSAEKDRSRPYPERPLNVVSGDKSTLASAVDGFEEPRHVADSGTVHDRAQLAPVDYLADIDAHAEQLRGYLVVQVVVDDAGHLRTHLYRSAAAAEAAVERARKRGRWAHVTLCQLLPVGVVYGLGVGQ